MRKAIYCLSIVLIVSMVFGFSLSVEAVEYPTDTIRFINPTGAGGGTDTINRAFAGYLEGKYIDEATAVTNMSGGSGAIGVQEVVRADPDGHTLLWYHTMGISTYMSGVLDVNVLEDLVPIASIAEAQNSIQIPADKPWDNLDDLIEYIRENPGEVEWGIGGIGGTTHLATAAIMDAYDLDIDEDISLIVYDGGADRRAAIAGGHVDVITGSIPEGYDFYEQGDLRYLAVTGEERNPELPDVPALKEFDVNAPNLTWFVFAPKGVSDEMVTEISNLFRRVAEDEEFLELQRKDLRTVNYRTGEELQEYLDNHSRGLENILRAVDMLEREL